MSQATTANPKWTQIAAAIHNAPMMKQYNVPNGIIEIITTLIFDWQWDRAMSFGIDLSKNDTFISHYDSSAREVKAPSGWQTTRGTLCLDGDHIYRWDILAVDYQPNYGDINIGVLKDDGFRITDQNKKEFPNESYVDKCTSWSLHSSFEGNDTTGNINYNNSSRNFGGSAGGGTKYGTGFRKGDTVTTIYDNKSKTLSFEINGIPQGVAFDNISYNL